MSPRAATASRLILAIVCAAALAGCASKRAATPVEPSADSPVDTGATTAAAPVDVTAGSGLESSGAATDAGGVAGPQGGLLSQRIVYFAFDRAEIRSEDAPMVAAHAAWLAANPQARIRLEGHTDERGTREYNIGLGERRAQTVRRALTLQGVADNQIATVSFGEERPAAAGEDEAAWSQNRRVELLYVN
ncbi:MAG: peptidoglycan-associated lipoprotein Pal [Steroidobacteraceae bacterium]